jgi:anion-transporting  ArsA/GET3 family ATPase
MTRISEIIAGNRVIVCCGAGGVGKTTTATGLALAAARAGRSVLALTIDPSKRLAQTLGVERNLKEPAPVPASFLEAAGATSGSLHAWMLDPQLVADRSVDKLSPTPAVAARLKSNRMYKQLSRMVAGMQEYTAMEALHGFLDGGEYDLVILDTPPSRNALDFLDGPRRLERFFDGRIFQLFLPGEKASFIGRAASSLIRRAMSGVFGEATFLELQEFFGAFENIMYALTRNALRTREMLSDAETVSFLLVTSPAPEALEDAHLFRQKVEALGLPFGGFVLNRSLAAGVARVAPDRSMLGPEPSEAALSGLRKLQRLAVLEEAAVGEDLKLLDELTQRAGEGAVALALPTFPEGAHDIAGLVRVARALTG